ncbi:UNVERIFIED_CONTAM: hypothetical protein K2H54_033129 [Gekko kuhli]
MGAPPRRAPLPRQAPPQKASPPPLLPPPPPPDSPSPPCQHETLHTGRAGKGRGDGRYKMAAQAAAELGGGWVAEKRGRKVADRSSSGAALGRAPSRVEVGVSGETRLHALPQLRPSGNAPGSPPSLTQAGRATRPD